MNLKWSKHRPKVNGLYWYSNSLDGRRYVIVCEVTMPVDKEDEAEVYICRMGTELFDTEWPKDGYWMGPITKPEAPSEV